MSDEQIQRARTPLLAVAVVVLLIGLVAVAARGGDETADAVTAGDAAVDSTASAPGATAATSTAAGAPETAPAAEVDGAEPDEGATTTVPPAVGEGSSDATATTAAAPSTTAAPSPTTTGAAPASLGPSTVPAGGTYTYDVTSDDGSGPEQSTADTVVDVLSGDRSAGRLRVSSSDENGGQVSTIDASASGFFIESTRVDSEFGTSDECGWEPEIELLPVLADGVSWSFDGSCETSIGGVPTTLRLRGSGRVVGAETVTVAGADRSVWVIEVERVLDVEAQVGVDTFEIHNETDEVQRYDPALGMVVTSESTSVTTGDQESSSTRSTTLVSHP